MKKERLANVIAGIFAEEQNKKARNKFLDATDELHPASCKVKIGWIAGESITFNCTFEKNGNGEIFEEIEKGIENPNEILHFIYGLNPRTFHFLPETKVDECKPNHLFLIFKLNK